MSYELQNDHNVYILGAGFSREAGLPLISDFLVKMRDSQEWLFQNNRGAEAQAIEEVLNFRLNAASAAYWTQLDLENIEELFSLASATPNAPTRSIKLAIAATLDYCSSITPIELRRVKRVEPSWAKQVKWMERNQTSEYFIDPYTHHLGKLLGMMRHGVPKGKNTFITFNYDTVLETALEKLDVKYNYGLANAIHHKSSKANQIASTAVTILKLHGSVNWTTNPEANALQVFGKYRDLRAAKLEPELIPPTWKKVFENQFSALWEQAVSSLQNATRIIVIGFSIPPTDHHFRYLLAAGLRGNISLRQIYFYDKAVASVKERAAQLLRKQYIETERIKFAELDFGTLCARNAEMAAIGRPCWLPKDAETIEF